MRRKRQRVQRRSAAAALMAASLSWAGCSSGPTASDSPSTAGDTKPPTAVDSGVETVLALGGIRITVERGDLAEGAHLELAASDSSVSFPGFDASEDPVEILLDGELRDPVTIEYDPPSDLATGVTALLRRSEQQAAWYPVAIGESSETLSVELARPAIIVAGTVEPNSYFASAVEPTVEDLPPKAQECTGTAPGWLQLTPFTRDRSIATCVGGIGAEGQVIATNLSPMTLELPVPLAARSTVVLDQSDAWRLIVQSLYADDDVAVLGTGDAVAFNFAQNEFLQEPAIKASGSNLTAVLDLMARLLTPDNLGSRAVTLVIASQCGVDNAAAHDRIRGPGVAVLLTRLLECLSTNFATHGAASDLVRRGLGMLEDPQAESVEQLAGIVVLIAALGDRADNLDEVATTFARGQRASGGDALPLRVAITIAPALSEADRKAAQRYLNMLGYAFGDLAEDGHFGSQSSAALAQFQSDYDLRVHGMLDRPTFGALAGAAADRTFLAECGRDLLNRPDFFSIYCLSDHWFEEVSWSEWTTIGATGRGVYAERACNPSCVEDPNVFRAAVTIRFENPQRVRCGDGGPILVFGKISVTYENGQVDEYEPDPYVC